MREAAEAQDFEHAAQEKAWMERLKGVSGSGCAWARTLDAFALVAVAQGRDAKSARVFAIGGGRVDVVCDVGLEEGDGAWSDAAARASEWAGELLVGFSWSEEELDTLGLVCDRMYSPKSGTRYGSVGFAWADDLDGVKLAKLAKRTLLREDVGGDDEGGLEICA